MPIFKGLIHKQRIRTWQSGVATSFFSLNFSFPAVSTIPSTRQDLSSITDPI